MRPEFLLGLTRAYFLHNLAQTPQDAHTLQVLICRSLRPVTPFALPSYQAAF
jgi:hypothetical protein